ncbi:hypothetical protein BE08_31990 [Sorangium cellulosum]|uniref:Uncharacterized protein n=1 Tax=Sorangium cellulosum TaxID=56 RepID=A0A150PKT5_SORCE|nr:hypothetical protein BE08_31990 [Sorangium cellulosum]
MSLESASARALSALQAQIIDVASKGDGTDEQSALRKAVERYKSRAATAKTLAMATAALDQAREKRDIANRQLDASAGPIARRRATAAFVDADKSFLEIDKAVREKDAAHRDAVEACNEAVRAYFEAQLGACTGECVKASRAVCAPDLDAGKTAVSPLAPSFAAAALGGVSWQAAALSGLADFLFQRADAELTLWLSTEISENLCSGTAPGALPPKPSQGVSLRPRDLFPRTCTIVGTEDAPTTPESGSLLAAALRRDLELLPARVASHAVKIDFEVLNAIEVTLFKMSEGVAPLEALAGLSINKDLEAKCGSATGRTKALACGLRLVGLATKLSADAVVGDYSKGDIRAFVLVLRDSCGSACGDAVIDEVTASAFFAAVNRFGAAVKAQRDRSGGSAAERATVMIAATLDLFDAGVGFFPESAEARTAWRSIEPALRSTTFFLRGEYADGLHAISTMLKAMEGVSGERAWQYVIRQSSLVADIAAAKDSKQVQAALEAAAAPVGSWRDKRRSPTLSATGLVGWSFGAEVPLDGGGGRRRAYAAGAPVGMVGVDLSFPVGSTWTVGGCVSILDVGQLVTLPLQTPAGRTNEVPATNEDVRLSQVLSPGGYLKLGLGASPLVLGAGVSYAPDLRSYVRRDADTEKEVARDVFSMWRFHAFLAVDVTILRLARFDN